MSTGHLAGHAGPRLGDDREDQDDVYYGEQASGRVIVVDADNEGLLPFYSRHSFRPTKSHPYAST